MKTSLILEDSLFDDAKREAQRTGKTIVPTLDTGGSARISLDRRSEWMDELDRLDELDKSGQTVVLASLPRR